MAEHSSGNAAQTPIICLFCDKLNVEWKCNECGLMCNLCKDKKHPRLTSSYKHRLVSFENLGKVIKQFFSTYLPSVGISYKTLSHINFHGWCLRRETSFLRILVFEKKPCK